MGSPGHRGEPHGRDLRVDQQRGVSLVCLSGWIVGGDEPGHLPGVVGFRALPLDYLDPLAATGRGEVYRHDT